jgi:hypothetical protein
LQHPAHARHVPAWLAGGGRNLRFTQPERDRVDSHARFEVPGEHLLYDRRCAGLGLHARRIARMVKIEPVAKERPAPGQQLSRTHVRQAAAAHPLAQQCALVFGDSPPDLQQQLVVGILAHGPLQELDRTAVLLKFLNKEHLVHIFAGQPIWCGHHDPVKLRQAGSVTQLVKSGTIQARPTVARIAKHSTFLHTLPLLLNVAAQAGELLVDRLGLGLPGGRDPGVQRDPHQRPPVGEREVLLLPLVGSSSAGGADTPDPSGSGCRALL